MDAGTEPRATGFVRKMYTSYLFPAKLRNACPRCSGCRPSIHSQEPWWREYFLTRRPNARLSLPARKRRSLAWASSGGSSSITSRCRATPSSDRRIDWHRPDDPGTRGHWQRTTQKPAWRGESHLANEAHKPSCVRRVRMGKNAQNVPCAWRVVKGKTQGITRVRSVEGGGPLPGGSARVGSGELKRIGRRPNGPLEDGRQHTISSCSNGETNGGDAERRAA